MLVCFVVPARRRRQIAAEIVEIAGAAVDVLSDAGFSRLIDEPAAARDVLDAFRGELLRESASAAAVQDAGLVYIVRVDEPANAADAYAGIYAAGIDVAVAEVATADSVQDASLLGVIAATGVLVGSRAGLGSMVVGELGGKTQIIPGIGAVT